MKRIAVYLIFCCVMQICSKQCIPATFDSAKQYFDLLSTEQISDVDLATLTDVQFHAFKDLSKQLFHREVASHSCSSQANRIKAEIMMQKIGAYY